jgi:small subunit ribosomal protein S20
MANMKNAEKRILVNAKKEVANNNYEATMKNSMKKLEKAIASKDKEKAQDALKVAIKAIDKANKAGVSKKNKSARNKSRLTKKVNAME